MAVALGVGLVLMSAISSFRIVEGSRGEARVIVSVCIAVGIVSGGAALVLLLRCLLQALLRSCPSEVRIPVAQAAKYCNRSLASVGLILSLIFLLLGFCWSIFPQATYLNLKESHSYSSV